MRSLRISFDTPNGFGAIPLDRDRGLREQAVRHLLGPQRGDPETYDSQVNFLVDLGQRALASGARLCGLLTSGADPIDVAPLTLSVIPLGSEPVDLSSEAAQLDSALALASLLRRRGTATTDRILQLDSGPVAAAMRVGRYRTQAGQSNATYGMQIFIPSKDFQAIAVVDVSTTRIELWPDFVQTTLRFANSLTLTESDDTNDD